MEIKERILQASHELFFKFGIKSITMDDISKHLAISKKTIYKFFEDKDHIVNALCHSDLHDRECVFSEIARKSDNAIDEMMKTMKHLGEMFSQMNPNLFYDLQKYHHSAWKQFRQFKEQFIMDIVEKNIKKGMEQGLYRSDINAKIMARFRIEQVEMAMNPEIFPPDKFNLTMVQMALLDHFLHGITTIKGHKLINKYKQIPDEE